MKVGAVVCLLLMLSDKKLVEDGDNEDTDADEDDMGDWVVVVMLVGNDEVVSDAVKEDDIELAGINEDSKVEEMRE